MDFSLSFLQIIFLYSQDNYFVSILFFFFFLFCYSAISLPGLIIFISISGYLFGMYYGFVISILSITFGSLVFFFLSKTFFKYFFIQYYEKYAQNINKYISNSSIEYLIIFRLVPGLPLMVQNIILSRTKNNIIMGISHKKYKVYGLQFHPESIGTSIGKNIFDNFFKLIK